MANTLDTILQKEKDQYNYLHTVNGGDGMSRSSDGMVHQLNEHNEERDKFEVFSSGSDLWFFYCGNSR